MLSFIIAAVYIGYFLYTLFRDNSKEGQTPYDDLSRALGHKWMW